MRVMLGISGNDIIGTEFPKFDGTQSCANLDTELFFPEGEEQTKNSLQVLIPICKACKFNSACLEYAIRDTTIMGIWGGTTEKERAGIRRMRRRRVTLGLK